jgi:D-glycero-alpha-D-manno-heptose 1-phosphate guanylyltransferase
MRVNNPIIILAGGFGTRLSSVLNGKPKALADVNGNPFIFYLIISLIDAGFNKFIFSLYFESEQIISYIKSIEKTVFINCEYVFIIEKIALGTGGAVSNIIEKLKIEDDFYVINGDTWIEKGAEKIINSLPNTIGVVEVDDVSRYGEVIIMNNKIISFQEKNAIKKKGKINCGIYKLSSTYFQKWNKLPYSLEEGHLKKLSNLGILNAEVIHSKFIDIGIPDDYLKFCNLNNIYK